MAGGALLFLRRYRKPHRFWLHGIVACQRKQNGHCRTLARVIVYNNRNGILVAREYRSMLHVVSRKLFRTVRFALTSRSYVAVTQKPREVRMGKGKGSLSYYTLPVRAGTILTQLSWCYRRVFPFVVAGIQRSCKKVRTSLYF